MNVCLVSVEFFGWGSMGGFGRATRMLGRELASAGVQVTAVVPRQPNQPRRAHVDGIEVLSYSRSRPQSAARLFEAVDADVYHSLEPSIASWIAQHHMPGKRHVVSFHDPLPFAPWSDRLRCEGAALRNALRRHVYEDNGLVRAAVYEADAVFAAARKLIAPIRDYYALDADPQFLPVPVVVPQRIQKPETPTVTFLSRWDAEKRPEGFFDLAQRFPDVHFIAAGSARDPIWDHSLRSRYGRLPNLELYDFLDRFSSEEYDRLLARTWILVNTAPRGGLPSSFLEAAASGAAILSSADPDDFASNFGFFAADGDFAAGLEWMLEDDRWRQRGEMGREYVAGTFDAEASVRRHLEIYSQLLERPRAGVAHLVG